MAPLSCLKFARVVGSVSSYSHHLLGIDGPQCRATQIYFCRSDRGACGKAGITKALRDEGLRVLPPLTSL